MNKLLARYPAYNNSFSYALNIKIETQVIKDFAQIFATKRTSKL
jgi:hypothetical protein